METKSHKPCWRRAAELICLLFAVMIPAPIAADDDAPWSVAELVGRSEIIAAGRVSEVAAARDKGTIYTYVTVDVDEVLKGWVPERQIVLKQLGGHLGDDALVVERQTSFAKGEAVLVFLAVRPEDRTLSTTGLRQGKWNLATDMNTGERIARRPVSGVRDRTPFGRPVETVSLKAVQDLIGPSSSAATARAARAEVNVRPREAAGATPVTTTRFDAPGSFLSADPSALKAAAQVGSLIGRVETRPAVRAAAFNVQTTRISVASDGTQANALSRDPAISADGRFVAFVSYASNLAPGASAGEANVFLRDTRTNQTTLIASRSAVPKITPDGRFLSYRSILDGGSSSNPLYVLDRQSGTTILLASAESISDDFRYVASESDTAVYCDTVSVLDRQTGQTTTVGEGSSPVLSGDGRYVAYFRLAECSGREGVWLTDLATLTSVRLLSNYAVTRGFRANRYILLHPFIGNPSIVVDRVTGQTLVAVSGGSSVSANGRYIGYVNPVPERHDLYVYDQQTNTLLRASAPVTGAAANANSSESAIDDSGRAVYRSSATNLVDGDTNGADDLFLTAGGIDASVPTEPRGLTAMVTTAGSSATVELSWSPPATGGSPTSYVIEAGSSSGSSNLASFSNGLATSLRAAVPLGTTAFVRVRAANDSGVSTSSNEINFTAGAGTPPGPPASLTLAGNVRTFVTLNWIPPASGDRPVTYLIQAGSSTGASDLATITTRSSETSFADYMPQGRYFLRVLAANSAGIGPPSNEVSFTSVNSGTCVPPQSAPTGLIGSASGSTVTLSFAGIDASPFASWVVQAGTTAGSSDIGSFDAGSFVPIVIEGVPPGTYYVRVRGRTCGMGPVSNEVGITVR